MRRHHVASTSVRRQFNVVCLLGMTLNRLGWNGNEIVGYSSPLHFMDLTGEICSHRRNIVTLSVKRLSQALGAYCSFRVVDHLFALLFIL